MLSNLSELMQKGTSFLVDSVMELFEEVQAQPPDTPCSLSGDAVREGSVLSNLSERAPHSLLAL